MKVWNYVIMFISMMVFLEFVGLPTGLSGTLNYFGIQMNSETSQLITADLESSQLYDFIFGSTGLLILLLTAGVVIVGFFTKSFNPELILLPFITTVLIKFIGTSWAIIKYAQTTGQQWLIAIIATIFIPLGVGYIIATVEWFKGTD